jgi:hypothetical protein
MMKPLQKAALSQVEYLEKKLKEIDSKIESLLQSKEKADIEIRDLYFQKGKLYSELELMKRVPQYD